ncbi:cyclic pyranopterin monophosphate synthase subunit MoaA [Oscillibacter sp. PC13]|uniref:GTP 3',8-cyclase MoaA n=1 Tax=Oscillibacter sp. PC13 TaxID=1855299 RepID=UPI0008F06D0C|nr:GTP 3',8-cyclase MoaA [Oscillibacter sp. PC13]SFP08925.1 cyclic pyranopterin monophosphate synthase subunit MoaA [Oscillibacter sp. PC13]
MNDAFGREITYLRLSVTDRCNLRCRYCMPEGGVEKRQHQEIASFEELEEMVQACVACGIRKVRVTGGEPLVRLGVVDFCRRIRRISGVEELCITTNGLLLAKYARDLKAAGVDRLNISLDTLCSGKYDSITRGGSLQQALDGLQAARDAGFRHTKLNTVLIGGFNDDEIPSLVELTRDEAISLRFIELMPIGECAGWDKSHFLPSQTVLERVPDLKPVGSDGVSFIYQIPGYQGTVGLISPISQHFCPSCNRIRITADGKLKPCLHSPSEIPLRGLHGAALQAAVAAAIRGKPMRHQLEGGNASGSLRNMNAIGG